MTPSLFVNGGSVSIVTPDRPMLETLEAGQEFELLQGDEEQVDVGVALHVVVLLGEQLTALCVALGHVVAPGGLLSRLVEVA